MRGLLLFMIWTRFVFAADFIPAWQAFKVTIEAESTQAVWVKFNIAQDYHLYKNKIKIQAIPTSRVKLGEPVWPDPIEINVPDIGKFKVYENKIAIRLPITEMGNGSLDVQINYQGCKDVQLCYPEQKYIEHLDLLHPNNKIVMTVTPTSASGLPVKAMPTNQAAAQLNLKDLVNSGNSRQIADWLFKQSFWLVVGGFFGVGILLAFTPCVFPLLPVLIGVVAGHKVSLGRSFVLALSYIMGGATMYALAGVAAASLGYGLAASLQSVWLSYLVALLFVIFSLSLFGAFELRLPHNLQNKLNYSISRFRHQSIFSAFIIGGLANLVLSPCVTGPLAGALVYISTTGNKLLGGTALFALGLGSGIPLLLIAVFGKSLLPKAGNWLYIVKEGLGLIMLLMALYMLSKVVIAADLSWLIGLWILIFIWFGIKWIKLSHYRRFIMITAGLVIISSIFCYNQHITKVEQRISQAGVTIVKTPFELQQALIQAKAEGKKVILDYYADWCVACKEMEIRTFADSRVKKLLQDYNLIRVDISNNNNASQLLQQKYGIIAPPSLVFIDKKGNSIEKYKTVGFIDGDKLLQNLKLIRDNKQ